MAEEKDRPPAQVAADQNLHHRHWSARCSKQMLYLPKGMPLNFCPYPQFNAMPLGKNEGLIKTSVSFNSLKTSHTSKPHLAHVSESHQIPRTLFIYLIIYFRLVVYIVTCPVYFYLMMQKWPPLTNRA